MNDMNDAIHSCTSIRVTDDALPDNQQNTITTTSTCSVRMTWLMHRSAHQQLVKFARLDSACKVRSLGFCTAVLLGLAQLQSMKHTVA